MQVYLSEQLLSSLEHQIYFIKYLLVIGYLVVDNPWVLINPFEADLAKVNFCVQQISVQVVKFVYVKTWLFIANDIKKPHFLRLQLCVAFILSKDQLFY